MPAPGYYFLFRLLDLVIYFFLHITRDLFFLLVSFSPWCFRSSLAGIGVHFWGVFFFVFWWAAGLLVLFLAIFSLFLISFSFFG